MRRRCESAASDMSVWSTDSRDGMETPMSCATPRNTSQSFFQQQQQSSSTSVSTPRTILRRNHHRRHQQQVISTPSTVTSLSSAATPWTRVKNNSSTPSTVEFEHEGFPRQGSISSPVVANLFGK